MKFHFFADWLNAVSILLSLFCVQHHHSIQYNVREENSLFFRYSIRSSSFFSSSSFFVMTIIIITKNIMTMNF